MRSFDLVDNKLAEADFFLEEIRLAGLQFVRVRYLFSAFTSASRSVTFAMQASLKGADGFHEWYQVEQEALRENRLARFFHQCRTHSQHIGYNQIVCGASERGKHSYYFGEPEPGIYNYVPTMDVLSACEEYLIIICGLVDRCYEQFGLLIDPDQIFTPEGLSTLGRTVEDFEEEIGLPRGWTCIDSKLPKTTEHRLHLLSRNIVRSGIKPILIKYLKRDLRYPTASFTIGKT